VDRVKLPKSFLAVNLSESHTFHKKEELDENPESEGKATTEEMQARAEEESTFAASEDPPEAL
jgi:inositol-hexakisphosphate/diphosphoinositol-pentakisphosphate 1-kinase